MLRTLSTAAALALLLPSTASAHGLGEDATGRSTLEFVPLGIEHMLLGWDHLLFIAGVVLIADGILRAAKLISLFALGHSLTLIIATLAGLRLNATLVDAVIALSVVYVGYLGLRGSGADRHNWRQISGIVFGFGLIHGLGLSTRLQDLGLSSDGLLGKVIAFNVGVELGQIAAISLMIGAGTFIARQLKDPHNTQRYASAALIPLGLLAGLLLAASGSKETSQPVAERTGGPAATTSAGTSQTANSCVAAEHDPAVFAGGAHPGASFMEPGATYNEVDLIHVITDGYVVVRYRPALATAQREEIRALVENSDDTILAVPDPKITGAYAVVASRRTLTCTQPDIDTATAFAAQWIDDVRAGTIKP